MLKNRESGTKDKKSHKKIKRMAEKSHGKINKTNTVVPKTGHINR